MTNYIRLPLKNAYNARDLGGYACDGGATRWRAFVRADGLERLDAADIRFLRDYGIKTVIDLRSADELDAAPDPEGLKEFADYVNIPLMSGDAADVTRRTEIPPGGFLPELYLSIFKKRGERLRRIMEVMAGAREGGILFHCAAGKDRTGVVSALLLLTAGVDRSDILSNYEITHTYIRQNPVFAANVGNTPKEYMYSLREYMQPSLDYIESLGGVNEYFREIGAEEAVIGEIRNRIAGKPDFPAVSFGLAQTFGQTRAAGNESGPADYGRHNGEMITREPQSAENIFDEEKGA